MRVFTACLLLMASLGARSEIVWATIDGLNYLLDTEKSEATVTGGDYEGDIVIPKSVEYEGSGFLVTSIGRSAFEYCSSLTSIVIPEGVTSIGYDAFWRCSSLTSITIPGSVTSIGEGAFRACSGLTSITIPESVTTIGKSAFSGCSSLTSINIPGSVTSIGDYAFSGCSSLTSINIPGSVTSIGGSAFEYCYSLTSITISEGVTSIGKYAFWECFSLTSITIPESVTSIEDWAFYWCTSLTSINIPESVTKMGRNPFVGCRSLQSVMISENNPSYTVYQNAIFTKDRHAIIAFLNYEATSYAIPEGVTSIGEGAFSGCSGLKNVYCLSTGLNEYESSVFYGIGDNAILYVPTHSIDEYSGWSECFSQILPGDPKQATAVANKGQAAHYTSFSNPYSDTELTVETGKTLTLYNVKVADGKMVLTERAGNKVAKGEGVLVRTDAADIVVTPLATTDLVPAEDNDLVATSVLPNDTVYAEEGRVLYRLTYKNASSETGLGFYLGVLKDQEGNVVSADGSALPTTAFKAYLSVPAEAASSGLDKAPAYGFELGEGDATGIDGLPIDGMKDASLPVYDLSGRRTTAPGKGIIIRGDKKYLVK